LNPSDGTKDDAADTAVSVVVVDARSVSYACESIKKSQFQSSKRRNDDDDCDDVSNDDFEEDDIDFREGSGGEKTGRTTARVSPTFKTSILPRARADDNNKRCQQGAPSNTKGRDAVSAV
jgi:hypothetical protein